jgi:anti-sigma regulatory factor (Ser/Thr protein kinase)
MSPSRLVHQAFLYDSPEHFAGRMAPVVRAGLERGDGVFVGANGTSIEALRGELGADAAAVEIQDTTKWAPRPADRLFAVQQMIDSLEPGRELLALGEPVWSGSDAVMREWARYESVINAVFANAPLRFVCLYDRAALSDRILAYGRATHGQLIDAHGTTCQCREYVPPERYVPALRPTDPVWPAPDGACEIRFEGDHRSLRVAVGSFARQRGMRPERVDELVLAANEISTNALLHGAAPVDARIWVAGGELICEISDCGPGIADPLAGWSLPARAEMGGWGLPLSRRLCDALEIARSERGTTIYLHMSLDGEPVSAA